MSTNNVVIRSDIENIISIPSDQYENDLQQELDELLFNDSEDESENEAPLLSLKEDDSEEDVLVINEDLANYCDLNSVCADNIKTQSNSLLTLHLTKEEQGVIDNCTDHKLKQLLLINRTKAMHIKELCKKLNRLYDDLGKSILKEKEKFRQQENVKENPELQSMAKTYIWKIGIPFFKDKSFYSAPPNRDVAVKRENKEFFTTKVVEGRKWTAEDQKILDNCVLQSYFKHRKSRLEQDIRLLKARMKTAADEAAKAEMEENLDSLETNLDELKFTKDEPPPLDCDEGIDWFKIATFELKARHSNLECKAFWNIYLHPSINKSHWTPEEDERIKALAIEYNCDWNTIAKELGTNRSAYLVCIHYNTKLCDKFKRERFLPEEDEFLLEVIDNCRLGDYIPWGRVAYYFEDRSKHQLYHRYKYYLSCDNIKKGTFTEAEDILISYLTEKFGKDFSGIAEYIPHRTPIQLRNRYSNYLEKLNIQLGSFTYVDDQKILNHVAMYGHTRWNILAEALKRNRAHVRQRYLTLRKCMDKYPDLPIDSVPRRKQTFLSQCLTKRNSRTVTCLEKLQRLQGIPTLATVETFLKQIDQETVKKEKRWRVLKTPVRKPRSQIDQKLIDFFKGSCKFQRETKLVDQRVEADSPRRIIKLFDVLGADGHLLQKDELANDAALLDRDKEMLERLKEVLQENKIKFNTVRRRNSFMSETVQQNDAGPSHADPLSIDIPKHSIKHLLPPNPSTLLGLRVMIIKCQLYKEENKSFSIVKLESTRAAPDNPTTWQIQQNLLKHDEFTKAKIEHERDVFYQRLWAIFKWPCILSTKFPQQLTATEEESQEQEIEDVIEAQQEKRKIGRPRKKVNSKILKMVEAKKRKRMDVTGTDQPERTDDNFTSTTGENTEPISNDEARPKKRGRPPNQSKTKHAVTYIPRRSHIKVNKSDGTILQEEEEEEMDVDNPNSISEVTTREIETIPINQNENIASSSTAPIINVSDINLAFSNAVIVDKDKINNLMKLNKFQNAKKIIVLEKTDQNFIADGKGIVVPSTAREIPHNSSHIEESFQEAVPSHQTEDSSQMVEVIIDQSNQSEPFLQDVYHPQYNNDSESSPQICIDEQQSNSDRMNWKSLHLSEAEKQITEPDLDAIGTASIESAVDIPEEDEQTVETNCDPNIEIKTESIISHNSGEDTDDISVDQYNNDSESSPQICIDEQQSNSDRMKWKSLHLSEAEKQITEPDVDAIGTTSIESAVDIPEEDEQTVETNCDPNIEIKTESIISHNSEEDTDDISVDLSKHGGVIDDGITEEDKAVIENKLTKTLKLSKTIQKMRTRMRSSRNVK